MTPQLIAQLLAAFGPPAIQLIRDLIAVWEKPALSKDEVLAILDRTDKSYDDYINEARGAAPVPAPLTIPLAQSNPAVVVNVTNPTAPTPTEQ
jgi:hypothetical protein